MEKPSCQYPKMSKIDQSAISLQIRAETAQVRREICFSP